MSEYNCGACRYFEEQPSGDGLCNWAKQNLVPFWIAPEKFKIYGVVVYEDSFVCPAWRRRDDK